MLIPSTAEADVEFRPVRLRFERRQRSIHSQRRVHYHYNLEIEEIASLGWRIKRSWGRNGTSAGTAESEYSDYSAARRAVVYLRQRCARSGYIILPVQYTAQEALNSVLKHEEFLGFSGKLQFLLYCIEHFAPRDLKSEFVERAIGIERHIAGDTPDSIQLDLFIESSELKTIDIKTRINNCILDVFKSSDTYTEVYQSLNILQCRFDLEDEGIVRLIVGHRQRALNQNLYGYFNSVPRLHDMMFAMIKDDKEYLGHLVQMREVDIMPYLNNDENLLQLLKEELAKMRLTLNMRAPGWKTPHPLHHFYDR